LALVEQMQRSPYWQEGIARIVGDLARRPVQHQARPLPGEVELDLNAIDGAFVLGNVPAQVPPLREQIQPGENMLTFATRRQNEICTELLGMHSVAQSEADERRRLELYGHLYGFNLLYQGEIQRINAEHVPADVVRDHPDFQQVNEEPDQIPAERAPVDYLTLIREYAGLNFDELAEVVPRCENHDSSTRADALKKSIQLHQLF
jgi:hypothetical protein